MPASLLVRPGAVASFRVELYYAGKPIFAQQWLRPGRRLLMRWQLRDSRGYLIQGSRKAKGLWKSQIDVRWRRPVLPKGMWSRFVPGSTDAEVFSREGDELIVRRDGEYRIDVVPAAAPKLRRSFLLRVDGQTPTIEITSPKAGALHRQGTSVAVTGRMHDAGSGLASAFLNGRALKLNKKGEYRALLPCHWGVQLVSLVVRDRAGNQTQTQRSIRCQVRRERGKVQKKEPTAASVQLRIHQRALDDNKRGTLNDVASILQRSFNLVRLDKLVPPTLVKGRVGLTRWGPYVRYHVQKNGPFQLEKSTFSLKLQPGAIRLRATLVGLVMPLKIQAGLVRQQPKVLAPLLTFDLLIGLALAKGTLKLRVIRTSNDASQLRIQGLRGVVGMVRGVIESNVRKRLQKGMSGLLQKRLFPILRRLLLSFQVRKKWLLPALLGRKPLVFRSRFSSIQITPKHLQAGFKAGIQTRNAYPPFLFPQGAIPWPDTGIAVAIALQSINEVMQSLWEVGGLSLNLTGLLRKKLAVLPRLPFDLPLPSLRLSFKQPPVLMPGGVESSFRLVLGDVQIALGLDARGQGGKLKRSLEILARLHLVFQFQFVPGPRGMIIALARRPERLSIDIRSLRGVTGLLPAEMAAGIEQIVHHIMPRLAVRLLRFVPLPGHRALKLPPKLQRWIPKLHIVPQLIAYRSGYMLVGLDIK